MTLEQKKEIVINDAKNKLPKESPKFLVDAYVKARLDKLEAGDISVDDNGNITEVGA